ncbi:hypothetical protein ES707_05435 [subsurface metagenome]
MKLYKITIRYCDDRHENFLVVAKNWIEASNLVMTKWREWKYWHNAYVEVITLIAQEGQYGKPNILLIGGNDE